MPLGAERIARGSPYFGYSHYSSYPRTQLRPVSDMGDGEEHGEFATETERFALLLTQRFDRVLLLRLKRHL